MNVPQINRTGPQVAIDEQDDIEFLRPTGLAAWQKAIHGIRNPWTPENIRNMNMTWIWPTGFTDGYSPKSKLPSCKKHQKPGQVQGTARARCPWSPHRSSDIQMSKALRGRSIKKVNCICMIEKQWKTLELCMYTYIHNIYYSRRSWKHRETLCFHSTLEHVHLEKSRVTSTLFQSIYFLPLSICCQWVLVRRDENEGGFLWGDLQLSHHGQVPLHTSFDPH